MKWNKKKWNKIKWNKVKWNMMKLSNEISSNRIRLNGIRWNGKKLIGKRLNQRRAKNTVSIRSKVLLSISYCWPLNFRPYSPHPPLWSRQHLRSVFPKEIRFVSKIFVRSRTVYFGRTFKALLGHEQQHKFERQSH